MKDSQVPRGARQHPERDHDDADADDIEGTRNRPVGSGEERVPDEGEEEDRVERPDDADEVHVLPAKNPKENEDGDDSAGDEPRQRRAEAGEGKQSRAQHLVGRRLTEDGSVEIYEGSLTKLELTRRPRAGRERLRHDLRIPLMRRADITAG